MTSIVALIPARAGSKRIPGKNTRLLGGQPLIAWTIQAAQQSGIFCDVVVASDDWDTCGLARQLGAASHLRESAPDDQPDIVWVRELLTAPCWPRSDAFAILRPTSPFRTAATIQRAWAQFRVARVHSLRAVQPVREHPGKMWRLAPTGLLDPLVGDLAQIPTHSRPTQTLEPIYVQNASLEIAWTRVVQTLDSISGSQIVPFFTEGYEGVDLNTEADWEAAERLLATGAVVLPPPVVARVSAAAPRE